MSVTSTSHTGGHAVQLIQVGFDLAFNSQWVLNAPTVSHENRWLVTTTRSASAATYGTWKVYGYHLAQDVDDFGWPEQQVRNSTYDLSVSGLLAAGLG